jgi:hypothetical protein
MTVSGARARIRAQGDRGARRRPRSARRLRLPNRPGHPRHLSRPGTLNRGEQIPQFGTGSDMPPPHPDHHAERKPLCVKVFRRSFSWRVRCPSGAVPLPGNLGPWPSSRPGMAVVLPRLRVIRPRLAAGAPPGPAASPAAGWQRPGNGRPCLRRWQARALGCLPRSQGGDQAREWLVRRAGAGGASRPRRLQSRSPAALPGPLARAAARPAPACGQAKMALLICRFSERRASSGVLPSAGSLP